MKKNPLGFGVQESTFKDISQVILMYLRSLHYRLYVMCSDIMTHDFGYGGDISIGSHDS